MSTNQRSTDRYGIVYLAGEGFAVKYDPANGRILESTEALSYKEFVELDAVGDLADEIPYWHSNMEPGLSEDMANWLNERHDDQAAIAIPHRRLWHHHTHLGAGDSAEPPSGKPAPRGRTMHEYRVETDGGVWTVEANSFEEAVQIVRDYTAVDVLGNDDFDSTMWVRVRVFDVDAEDTWEDIDFTFDPPVPDCDSDQNDDNRQHSWVAPYEVVGGLEQNPGVWAKGGRIICEDFCEWCGTRRTQDGWDTDNPSRTPEDSVTYREPTPEIDAWIGQRLCRYCSDHGILTLATTTITPVWVEVLLDGTNEEVYAPGDEMSVCDSCEDQLPHTGRDPRDRAGPGLSFDL